MKARVLYDSSEKTDAGPYSTLSGKDNVPRWARASRSHCLALIMLSYEAGSRGLADSRPRMIRHEAARLSVVGSSPVRIEVRRPRQYTHAVMISTQASRSRPCKTG